jgi:predicted methyltransferase
MLQKLALTALLFAASFAQAFDTSKLGQRGSLPLSDIGQLIGQSAQLKGEVSAALAAAQKTADQITCDGNRFPGEWVHLGGLRAAPYNCDFNGKWLMIDAKVRVTGANGHVYDAITRAAMRNAVKVTETNPTWRWTKQEPN